MKIKSILEFCLVKGAEKNMILILNLRQEVREKNLSCVRSILKNS